MLKVKKTFPRSISINIDELGNLKKVILRDRLQRVPVTSEYELLRIKDGDIAITVYKSGKLVHNGSEQTVNILTEIMKKETFFDYLLGSDETGKGEWYGPLVATCMSLNPDELEEFRLMGIRDSKSIKKDVLLKMADEIIKKKPIYRSRILMPETYNKMYAEFQKEGKNLNELLAWAHTASIKDVLEMIKYERVQVVIDKFDVEKTYERLTGIDKSKVEVIQKSKGETEIPVAAASIIAKRAFETSVDELNKKYQINLRSQKPEDIDPSILPFVAKIHFRNVKKYIH